MRKAQEVNEDRKSNVDEASRRNIWTHLYYYVLCTFSVLFILNLKLIKNFKTILLIVTYYIPAVFVTCSSIYM
jgi:hypothetical protein